MPGRLEDERVTGAAAASTSSPSGSTCYEHPGLALEFAPGNRAVQMADDLSEVVHGSSSIGARSGR